MTRKAHAGVGGAPTNDRLAVPAPADSAESEAALVQRLKAGDDAAFEIVMQSHAPRLYAVARKFLSNEQDAQDAVQDAFLSALSGLGRFEGTSLLSTWLHRITVNACLMKLRTRRRKPESSIEGLLPQFAEDGHQRSPSAAWKPIVADGIEQAEVRALIRAKIEELPDDYREVLLLRDIEELDTEEAATVLGISSSAVKTRLHRARQALRTLLDPYFREEGGA